MTDILRVRERIRTWRSRSLPCRVGIPLHVGSVPRRIPRGRSSTIKGRKKRIYRKYLSELLRRGDLSAQSLQQLCERCGTLSLAPVTPVEGPCPTPISFQAPRTIRITLKSSVSRGPIFVESRV